MSFFQVYDRIFLRNEVVNDDQLYINENQINKFFKCLELSANKHRRIKCLLVSDILPDSELPSLKDVEIILVPFPIKSDTSERRIWLAAFFVSKKLIKCFYQKYNEKNKNFQKIRAILQQKLDIKFTNVDRRSFYEFNEKEESGNYNDGIYVFRLAEEISFTGDHHILEPFNIDEERRRISIIYDLMNRHDWDGKFPDTLQGVSRTLIESTGIGSTTEEVQVPSVSSTNNNDRGPLEQRFSGLNVVGDDSIVSFSL
uniref:Uncharacterized protein n=1 Tax=Panagrolaimus davidi TaxID=227884 RepID=A0A914PP00_9BILA